MDFLKGHFMQRVFKVRLAGIALASLTWLIGAPIYAQIDLSGEWADKFHEDWPERVPGPDVADYTALPINDAARAKADSWEASVQTLPERQCIAHPFPYSLRGPANLRIWAERDSGGVPIAWKMFGTFGRATHTVWMDGRPHPSKYALHTWEGFTTGVWEGDMLTTYTTHIKMGYLRRNGVPTSDETTVTEHWMRHGDTLTAAVIIEDPIYLTEPYIRSSSWRLNPAQLTLEQPCEPVVEVERTAGEIPHFLPGKNPFLNEESQMYGIPEEAVRGGAQTMYPEYRKFLKDKYVAPEQCKRYCCGGGPGGGGGGGGGGNALGGCIAGGAAPTP
jgi:hypothetical protein